MLKTSREIHVCSLKIFTLIELLVAIGVVAMLVSMLMPSLHKAREAGRGSVCFSNLRQLGMGVMLYADDFDNWLTPPRFNVVYSTSETDNLGRYVCETDTDSNWPHYMAASSRNIHFSNAPRLKYINGNMGDPGSVFTCPSDPSKRGGYSDSSLANGRDYLSYGLNEGVCGTKRRRRSWSAWCRLLDFDRGVLTKRASNSVLLADRDSTLLVGYSTSILPSASGLGLVSYGDITNNPGLLGARHKSRKVNAVFVDGHVASVATPILNNVSGGVSILYWLSPFHADGADLF